EGAMAPQIANALGFEAFVNRYAQTADDENPGLIAAIESGLRPPGAGADPQFVALEERLEKAIRRRKAARVPATVRQKLADYREVVLGHRDATRKTSTIASTAAKLALVQTSTAIA